MAQTHNSLIATTGTTTLGYSGTYVGGIATPLNGGSSLLYSNGSEYNSLSTAITNSNNMRTRQVKVAVFIIERNDKNEVISSKFVKELWVEIKNGASLDLAVAKELKGDFDPETTIIREITSFSF
jgi:hypothetical protein